MLESIRSIEAAEYEVKNEYCRYKSCRNVPLNYLAYNKVNKADEECDSACFTDCTTVSTEEELEECGSTCNVCSLIKVCKRCCACCDFGNYLVAKTLNVKEGADSRAACNRCKREEHKYTGCDSGVYYVLAKTAEEALNYNNCEHRTNCTLPKLNLCGKVKSEDKTCNERTAVAYGLLLLCEKIENKFRYDCTCNASKNYPESLKTKEDNRHNGCGNKSYCHVKHYVPCGYSAIDMRCCGNVKLFH